MDSKKWICLAAAISGLLLTGAALASSDDEIQVYDDAIGKPGEIGLDIHTNYVPSGAKTPAWPRDAPSDHSFRVTPEFNFGLTETLEAGLYLPFLRESNGSNHLEGAKVRLKYLSAPKNSPYYLGLNGELGHVSIRSAEQRWNLEVRPIIGYKIDKWQFTLNPILGFVLSGEHSNVPEFSPAVRASYELKEDLSFSLEHYAGLGQLNNIVPYSQQTHNTFVVVDAVVAGHNVDFGVGKGWNANSDKWTVKAIINFPIK